MSTAKPRGRRAKMSAIVDMASSGMQTSSEFAIKRRVFMYLQACFNKAARGGALGRVEVSRDDSSSGGYAAYVVKFDLAGGGRTSAGVSSSDYYSMTYVFKKFGGKRYLNISCNPTRLVSGSNALPVLVAGKTPLESFSLMLRLPFTILEDVLSGTGFKWEGGDKRRLVAGDINLQYVQIAFYSGAFNSVAERASVMKFLSSSYGSRDDAVGRNGGSAAALLGLDFSTFDNNVSEDGDFVSFNSNFRVVAKNPSKKQLLSMTAYCKDEVLKVGSPDGERVGNLIRFDCSLYSTLLHISKVNTVALFESKYKKECDKGGYDLGFTSWLADLVFEKIKLRAVLGVDREKYYRSLSLLEEREGGLLSMVFRIWLGSGGVYFPSVPSVVKTLAKDGLETTRYHVERVISELRDDYGIDVDLHPSFVDAMFVGRAIGMMTEEERRVFAKYRHGGNQLPADVADLHDRAERACDVVRKRLLEGETGLLKIRRFSTKKVREQDFYIRRLLRRK